MDERRTPERFPGPGEDRLSADDRFYREEVRLATRNRGVQPMAQAWTRQGKGKHAVQRVEVRVE